MKRRPSSELQWKLARCEHRCKMAVRTPMQTTLDPSTNLNGIGATIPQSREAPVADEATLKAEIPTIYNWLYDQCANTAAGCEHQTQRTQKQHIRVRIRIHLHKLPCRSISSIGARTLNVSRHRSSQLAFLSALSCHVRHRPSA